MKTSGELFHSNGLYALVFCTGELKKRKNSLSEEEGNDNQHNSSFFSSS